MFSRIAVIVILVLSGALYVVHGKAKILRLEKQQLERDLAAAINANEASGNAIDRLAQERDRTLASCGRQMTDKNRTITGLRDALAACTGGTYAESDRVDADHNGVGASAGDAVLGLLDGMLPCSADRDGDAIRGVPGPGTVSGTAVPAGEMAYCLDRNGALRLAANIGLLCDWAVGEHDKLPGVD